MSVGWETVIFDFSKLSWKKKKKVQAPEKKNCQLAVSSPMALYRMNLKTLFFPFFHSLIAVILSNFLMHINKPELFL